MKSIMVIAAHPDDEVLGCGGTIAWHTDNNHEVNVLIVSEGITSRSNNRDSIKNKDFLTDLKKNAEKANEILGVRGIQFLDYPDNRLDSVDRLDVIKSIEKAISENKPDTIYTHFASDLNIDHRIVQEAVITAARPLPGNQIKTVLSFEIASSTDWQTSGKYQSFSPNWYVDISKHLDRKLSALEIYSSEMRDWPHARSIEAIQYNAKLRGSQIGTDAAEAFQLLRHLE